MPSCDGSVKSSLSQAGWSIRFLEEQRLVFKRYIFEDPVDHSMRIYVGGWGYVAAGVGGSFYVLRKAGRSAFNRALVRQLAILGILVVTILVTSELPVSQQVVVLIAAIPGLLTFQSLWMVRIIRKTFVARGWIVDTSV